MQSAFLLRLVVPKHFAEDNGVCKITVFEVHIRQEGS